MANIPALQSLQGLIQRTKQGLPKVQEQAIETGDFTELRRAQGVIKQLSGIADRLTAGQQENLTPAPPAPQPPKPVPTVGPESEFAPPPAPPPKPSLQSILNAPPPATPPATGPYGVSGAPPLTPRDPATNRPASGSLRDLIDIEIPHAINELGKLGGYLAGESDPAVQSYSPAGPTDLGEHQSYPIQAPKPPPKPPPEVWPVSNMTNEDRIRNLTGQQAEGQVGVRSLAPAPPPAASPEQEPTTNEDPTTGPMDRNPFQSFSMSTEGQQALAEAEKRAQELGETPVSVLESVQQMAQETPGDDAEKEFLRRVQMLGLDRKVPTWERFLTAMAYGAANIFSRWVSRNWRMPLNFPDLMAQDRRDDETRRQIALQLLSERAGERRQKVANEAMAARQAEVLRSREKIAETRATAQAGRKKAKDAIVELNQNLDAIGKINRELEREYEAKVGAVTARIKSADDILKNRGTPTAIPGEFRFTPEDVSQHEATVAPLYAELERLRTELAGHLKGTRSSVMGQ